MVGTVQSEPYYGVMDKTYKKSSGKDVSVKSIKCNNVNVNVNGLELNVLPPALSSLLTGGEADNEGQYGTSSYGSGSGEQSRYDNNSFKFVCINNNNNTVIVEEEPPVPPVDECAADVEACFQEFLPNEIFQELEDALDSSAGVTVEINGITVTLTSFADICEGLEGLTYEQLLDAVEAILDAISPPDDPIIAIPINLVNCIAEALDIPIPITLPR